MALSKPVDQIVEETTNPLLVKHESWERIPIGDIAEIDNGFAFKSKSFNKQGEGMPLIRIRDVTRGETETYYDGEYDEPFLVNPGDLLIGMDGDFNSARWTGRQALLNQRVCRVRLTSDVFSEGFLTYALQPYLDEINKETSSVTVKHLSSKTVSQIPLPFPPLPEQRRIVARIEELFSRLDAGVAALRHAKAQLQRYRQSVLAAAVTGQLTQAWREQHPDTEPADELLERILEAHREKWNGRGKYKEPTSCENRDLPNLPQSWVWGTTTQLFNEIKDGTHDTPKYQESGIPFITQKHIKPQGLVFEDYKFISQADHEHFYKRSNPEAGDILISMIGVNRGQSCIVPATEVFSIKNVGLFKPHHELTNVKFLQTAVSSLPAQQRLLKKSKGGAQPFVGLTELRNWALPLPPLAEQHQIVAEVEARTTTIDHLDAELDRQITRSNRLRQSTLAAAFAGNLL
jgi:type I restriction enzyme S subunit